VVSKTIVGIIKCTHSTQHPVAREYLCTVSFVLNVFPHLDWGYECSTSCALCIRIYSHVL